MPSMTFYLALSTASLLYALGLVIYRIFFHPLAKFPGPKLAAATKWYEFWFDVVKYPGGTFAHEIERIHREYGPIVRINPAELHVKDSDWLGTLYSGPSSGQRDKYAPAAHMTGTPDGIFGTVSHEVHRKRRAALGPFFSKAAVATSEEIIYAKVNTLSRLLKEKAATGGIIELRQTFLALTTDTLSRHTFDRSSDLLSNEQAAAEWLRTVKSIAGLTPLVKQYTWIIPLALKSPLAPLRAIVPDLARIVALRLDLYQQAGMAIDDDSRASTIASTDAEPKLPRASRNLFQSLLGSKHLSPMEKERDRITQEAFVVLVAGSETTARILTNAMYHLLANPKTSLLRLKEELATLLLDSESPISVKELEQLPWLTAVVKESLRITALVTSRMPLEAPDEVLKYGEWEIPAKTPVSMTLRDVLLDPLIFPGPMDFIPERWLAENPDLHNISHHFVPFSRGTRMCLGQNFAMAELYVFIAYLVRHFDFELFDTVRERDVDAVRDCFISESSPHSPGVRVKVVKVDCMDTKQ
ncbi:hypothetical protein XANCAGTX0491_009615 [Xanthoria calcicola]